ncbi:MAG: AAA family ATPase [Phycisphaeraceae bacterium]|nr:AAA family ATPase [Phycisphaeraceae bacterium]
MTIAEGDDGRALVKCMAGCDTSAVVDAMGLKMADLFPPRNTPAPHQQRRIVATYDYTDEAGKLLFQSVRYEPKGFKQRRSDGKGGWTWSLNGVRRVLYRLTLIIEAGEDSFIFMVEGEKDADRISTQGTVATTTSGGACKGNLTDLTPLHNRHIVLLPDNDATGRKHVQQLAALLHGKAASVRVLDLAKHADMPAKGDVSDWLDAGHDTDELIKLAECTPTWEPSDTTQSDETQLPKMRALAMRIGIDVDDEMTSYLWRRRLINGSLNVLFSRPGRGKSTVAADITAHVTRGRSWADGSVCESGSALYLRGEGTDRAIHDRMLQAGADPSRYAIIGRAEGAGNPMIDLASDVPLLAARLDDLPYTKLIIVDTLDSLYPSMNMIDNAKIRACLWPLQELAASRNICVLICAHTNKGGHADPLDRLSGGRAIGGAARAVWYLGKIDCEADEHYLACVKANDFLAAPAMEYAIVGCGNVDMPGAIRWIGERDDVSAWDLDNLQKQGGDGTSKAQQCADWLAHLLAGGPVEVSKVNTLAEDAGFGEYVIKKAKRALNIDTKAAKGIQPVRWYLCLQGQTAPVLDIAMSGGGM